MWAELCFSVPVVVASLDREILAFATQKCNSSDEDMLRYWQDFCALRVYCLSMFTKALGKGGNGRQSWQSSNTSRHCLPGNANTK